MVSILRTLLARARALRRSARADPDLEDELRAYADARTAAYEQRGLTPAEARRAALIEIGGVEQVKERVRDVRGAGLMWGVDITEPAADVIARARDAGLLVISAGEHTLRLLPPLVISRDDLLRGLAILKGALQG